MMSEQLNIHPYIDQIHSCDMIISTAENLFI